MLKYEDREVEVIEGYVKVLKEGTPLDGKYFFRKKKYQDVFDKLRSQSYIDDYCKDRNYFAILYKTLSILKLKNIMAKRENRGGRREGSGRKKLGNVAISIRLPENLAQDLRGKAQEEKCSLGEYIARHLAM